VQLELINLINADNNSLVSGTAAGVLVAASLAPAAALVGMSAAMGRWDMAVNGIFLLILQLIGINLAGSLVFRFYGQLKPAGSRYQHGQKSTALVSFGITVTDIDRDAYLAVFRFYQSPTSNAGSGSRIRCAGCAVGQQPGKVD
jgi:hypothetical protein